MARGLCVFLLDREISGFLPRGGLELPMNAFQDTRDASRTAIRITSGTPKTHHPTTTRRCVCDVFP